MQICLAWTAVCCFCRRCEVTYLSGDDNKKIRIIITSSHRSSPLIPDWHVSRLLASWQLSSLPQVCTERGLSLCGDLLKQSTALAGGCKPVCWSSMGIVNVSCLFDLSFVFLRQSLTTGFDWQWVLAETQAQSPKMSSVGNYITMWL